MTNSMATDEQVLAVGTIISLYTIDCSEIGGGIYRFVAGPFGGDKAIYNQQVYTPMPIEVDGISYVVSGSSGRPTLKISKLNNSIITALVGLANWRGAKFTRLRTLTKYLDGQPAADANRHWPLDVFRVEQMTQQSRTDITWILASALDFDAKKLPGRNVYRDVCSFRYRKWNTVTNTFDTTLAECPYKGATYFDAQDNPVTDPAKDVPSRRASCCAKRFPSGSQPFGGFLGVARSRTT